MKITFWGVRGSIATAGPQVARVGGNTTCIEVEGPNTRLIIDAGTGIRALGDRLLRRSRASGKPVEASVLFTHLHWDHIQGFPFFAPAFVPTTRLDLYGPAGADGHSSLQDVLTSQMCAPSFPVPLAAMGAKKVFHTAHGGSRFEIGELAITTSDLCHPQGALAYRVECGGKSMVFATDTELGVDDARDDALLTLAEGADLLIHDAQYTEAEYATRHGWGHSTYVAAARAARACGASRFALTHHDPEHDDDTIDGIVHDARSIFDASFAAREGVTVRL